MELRIKTKGDQSMTKRMTRPLTIAVAIIFWGAAAPIVTAQTAQELLKQAYELVERGRNDEALQKINEVLSKDPSAEEAYQLRNTLQSDQWVRMAIQNNKLDAAVQEIFNRSRPAAAAQTADPETIKKLVEEARGGDFQAQGKAIRTLAANHGDYAVAYLWQDLGSNDTERRVSTIAVLRQLGSDAPLPLIQVLEASEPLVRANAATVLGLTRDDRAVPYLARLASMDEDPTVKAAAAAAFAKFGAPAGGSSGQLYLAVAERYYRRDQRAVNPYRTVYPVWAFVKEGDASTLVAREVPREIYHLKLAEEVLYDLLAIEPNNEEAHVLLGSVLLAQAEFGRNLKAEGDDAPIATATAEARQLAATLGAATLSRVVAKAVQDGRADVAEGAVGLLATMLDGNSFGSANGLTTGVAAGIKSVRFASAIGIAGIAPRADFTGRELVVPALTEALGQDIVRNVLVIDDNSDSRNRILSDLNSRQYFAVGTDNGAVGILRLREFPIEDLVVVRYSMNSAPHVAEIVRAIRSDPRTEKTPIAMVVEASEAEAAKNQYQDKVQLFINSPPVADAYEPQLKPLVAAVDTSREQATLTAAAAASALEHMDPRGSVLASASAVDGLRATLKGDDRVRGPAIRALGRIGDGAATADLLALSKDSAVAEPLRADALVSLARIARAAGATSPDVMAALREAYMAQGSPEFMKSVSRAIGIAPMTLKECVEILTSGRAKAMIDQVK
jgi:CheY-like chemotaxis protein